MNNSTDTAATAPRQATTVPGTRTMKAVTCSRYGTPGVLHFEEVQKPSPKDNEVLIKIHASVVTPADCAFRKADPFIVRFMYGLTKPKFSILGVELAGVIESTGKDVTRFKPGDQVFGLALNTFGTHAEYVCLSEDQPIVLKPEGLSFEEIAGIVDGAPTALTFLKDVANVERGQSVLVNGASGAVGMYAVQLAVHLGARVTGVCGPSNVDLVKSLGTDEVIDYTKQDFTESGRTYDVIFDAVGTRNFSDCKKSLSSQGLYLTTVPTMGVMLRTMLRSKSKGKRAIFAASGLRQNQEKLNYLKGLCEAGTFRAVIDRRYALKDLADAHSYVEKGHKKGNVIIRNSYENNS